MEKLIKNKGITLVALVITIIILLILAGVSIQAITNTGLFKNAKKAQENYSIKEAEENLTIKLMQLQTNTISELGRNAKLEDIDELINKNSKFYDKDIEDVKDKKQNKAVKIAGYYFEIDNNLNIIGKIDASEVVRTDVGYKINTINENTINVTVKIRNEEGIKKIIKPDNSEMILNDQKEQIEIEYNVEEGKEYKFKVLLSGSDTIKEYVLRPSLDIGPEIIQSNGSEYPILTVYGVETNKKVTINYGKNKDNYYSLDNGITWKEYTKDGISVKKECTILAKSVVDGEITKEVEENVTMQMASDALESAAYNGDGRVSGVNIVGCEKRLNVDSSIWGRNIKIYGDRNTFEEHTYIYCYNSNKEIIETFWNETSWSYGSFEITKTIPQNTAYIIFGHGGYLRNIRIDEIEIQENPIITEKKYYATLTQNGVEKAYSLVSIEYYPTIKQREYKIGEEEKWNTYIENQLIKVNDGDTIYIKSIKEDGTEKISEKKIEIIEDGLGINAYNGDGRASGVNIVGCEKRLNVDSSIWGRNIKIYGDRNTFEEHTYIYCYNSNKEIIETFWNETSWSYGSFEITKTIPQNTAYIIFGHGGYLRNIQIDEIEVIK